MIFIVNFVPSIPLELGTYLNHLDFFAIVDEMPDMSFII